MKPSTALSLFLILWYSCSWVYPLHSSLRKTRQICNTPIGKSIVTISSSDWFPLNSNMNTIAHGVGWIINCAHKLIVAPYKLANKFKEITITVTSNSTFKAISIYDNPWLSFSILRWTTPNDIECTQIPINQSTMIKPKTNVSCYGVANIGNFIKQNGTITNNKSNISLRYGSVYKIKYTEPWTLLDASLLYNLIAVSDSSTQTVLGIILFTNFQERLSYALNIEYIQRIIALYEINHGNAIIETGELGIKLKSVDIAKAKDAYNYSTSECGEAVNAIVIDGVLPKYNSEDILFKNDVWISINYIKISNDVKIIDRELNKHIGKEVVINVCRNGESIFETVLVNNSQAYQVDKFISLNIGYGKVIKLMNVDLVTMFRNEWLDLEGIIMEDERGLFLIKKINEIFVNSINDFLVYVVKNCGENMIFDIVELNSKEDGKGTAARFAEKTYNLKREVLKNVSLVGYNYRTQEWKVNEMDIGKNCKRG